MENDPYQISSWWAAHWICWTHWTRCTDLVLLQSTSLIFFFYFFYLSLLLISNGDSLMRPEDCQIGSKYSLKVFLWRRTQQMWSKPSFKICHNVKSWNHCMPNKNRACCISSCACVTMARDHGTVTMSTMGFALGTNHPIIDSPSIHHSLVENP